MLENDATVVTVWLSALLSTRIRVSSKALQNFLRAFPPDVVACQLANLWRRRRTLLH